MKGKKIEGRQIRQRMESYERKEKGRNKKKIRKRVRKKVRKGKKNEGKERKVRKVKKVKHPTQVEFTCTQLLAPILSA